jgi:hypothetical protein
MVKKIGSSTTKKILAGLSGMSLVAIVAIGQGALISIAAETPKYPTFEVDPSFPKLPNNWVNGHVASVAADRHGNIWLLTRPSTVPEADRPHAAPSVLEFDANGKFLQSWGGPGAGFDWPDSEHGLAVDYKDNVWITGSSPASKPASKQTDDMVLKFTSKGKFLLQIGGRSSSGGNTDTKNVHLATDVFVDPETNEAFVSDGYGNRRVIVFDADTGAFKRMWGAFGNPPTDWQKIDHGMPLSGAPNTGERAEATKAAPAAQKGGAPARPKDTTGQGPDHFGNETPGNGPTHAVIISNDRMVYVCDRSNRRIQVFTPAGKYLTQVFINRTGPSEQSAARVAFSPDKAQQYMYVADYGNSRILVLDRKSLQVLYQFAQRGPKSGEFQGLHHIATDTKGNIYTGEVAPGARAQKFIFRGFSTSLPVNALTPVQIDAQMQRQLVVAGDDDDASYNYLAGSNRAGELLLFQRPGMLGQNLADRYTSGSDLPLSTNAYRECHVK